MQADRVRAGVLTTLERARYTLNQGVRVAWYMGHYYAAQPYYTATSQGSDKPPRPNGPTPDWNRMMSDLAELFRGDLANVERGLYPMPQDRDGSALRRLATSRRFFADLPDAARRRREEDGQEVFSDEVKGLRPRYFLQNFHYQTGGYLTEASAELYDMQVEVLFSGTANAMRRQALAPIYEHIRGRRQSDLRLLDVACGTGTFLVSVKDAFPRLPVTGIDLSDAYAKTARKRLARRRAASIATANAEALPFANASFDLVTCIYLFHELPPKIRRNVAGEIARVLKPGGRLVFVDSLQFGDVPDYDGLLELFPVRFHEPYYDGYAREDLGRTFGDAGLGLSDSVPAFLSKVATFNKPAPV